MSLFWPRSPKPSPNVIARLGRVLHWGLALAALGAGIGAIFMVWPYQNGGTDSSAAMSLAIAAVCAFFVGRAVRYILAGE